MAVLRVGGGEVSIGPCAGRGGDFAGDLVTLLTGPPDLVLSLTESAEMERVGAAGLPEALAAAGVVWRHVPVRDYGAPEAGWPDAEAAARDVLARGGHVHVHCMAGCGRSGAAVLRLMVASGEAPAAAMVRLRSVRPCAVETPAQYEWATTGSVWKR